jgi:transcriptional regulator with XRE-family HTH domain
MTQASEVFVPGGRLRVEREKQHLTQTELALAAGVSRGLVSAVEGGRQNPGVDAALAIANVLGLPVELLFGSPPRSDSDHPCAVFMKPPPHRERLRIERERLHLTQTELAQAAGVSRQLVSTVEAGRHTPNVAAAIDVPV